MDRRERYDPEDIEILMQERSFDELLEEERAYVLRHVSDRAEYEAMRSLLMHMREDARDHDPIEADPAIRANVIQAFRNEQQPQWRIWLNSVGAALFPEEAKAMWRPALALAGLALVVVVSVFVVRQAGVGSVELAEVRPEKVSGSEQQQNAPEQAAEVERENAATAASTGSESKEDRDHSGNVAPISPMVAPQPMEAEVSLAEKTVAAAELMEMEDQAYHSFAEEPATVREEVMTESETLTRSHVVTVDELSRNMSVANATGKVQVKERRAVAMDAIPATTSTSMAENPALLELVAAGW